MTDSNIPENWVIDGEPFGFPGVATLLVPAEDLADELLEWQQPFHTIRNAGYLDPVDQIYFACAATEVHLLSLEEVVTSTANSSPWRYRPVASLTVHHSLRAHETSLIVASHTDIFVADYAARARKPVIPARFFDTLRIGLVKRAYLRG